MTESHPSLEQVIADAREEAAILRRNGHAAQADTLLRFLDAVSISAEDYLTWLTEDEAHLRSGKSAKALRALFPALFAQGLAKLEGHRRRYRACAIPQRAHLESARRAGERAA
jgi:hypothetical protein